MLAGTLAISRERTIDSRADRIKDYLANPSHVDIAPDPRLTALFQAAGKTRTRARNPSNGTVPPG